MKAVFLVNNSQPGTHIVTRLGLFYSKTIICVVWPGNTTGHLEYIHHLLGSPYLRSAGI